MASMPTLHPGPKRWREPVRTFFTKCSIALLALICLTATASAAGKRVKYVAPDGFAGHRWGDLHSTFARLPAEPVGVGAAWIQPQLKETAFHCVPPPPLGPTMSGAVEGCDFHATLLTLRRNFEGGGFYVLSEYAIENQGFRFGEEADGVVLHPVVYQFCANWDEVKKDVPPNFDAMNKFCGMRMLFQSESREELAKLPADHVTVYDKVLDKLLAKFGQPSRFVRRGQVVIETEEGETRSAADRKFSIWRWCPARDSSFHTDCTASVTLTIDPKSGRGAVLYSTPLLWEYAFAREKNGFKGDWLYRVLHARR
jgi:hypothetical protein